jgi:NAD-dependent dihydropyrimidine dehydrogenase PreA subunit
MSITESELRTKIQEAISSTNYPVLWGVCDFDPSLPLDEKYEKVLVFVIPSVAPITLKEYVEPIFKHQQFASAANMMRILSLIPPILKEAGIRFGSPPHSKFAGEFEIKMNEGFNGKEAARRAGLGWIGKSNLLVTPEFGPQVNIATFLLDAPLTSGTPIDESRCGNCHNCVDACPSKAIHGVLWQPGMPREQQVDFAACSSWRLKTYEHLGRKITCAKCVIACPRGWKRSPVAGGNI